MPCAYAGRRTTGKMEMSRNTLMQGVGQDDVVLLGCLPSGRRTYTEWFMGKALGGWFRCLFICRKNLPMHTGDVQGNCEGLT